MYFKDIYIYKPIYITFYKILFRNIGKLPHRFILNKEKSHFLSSDLSISILLRFHKICQRFECFYCKQSSKGQEQG